MTKIKRRREFALMLLPGRRYRVIETNGSKQLRAWKFGGREYKANSLKRFSLEGYWHPMDKEGLFSDLLVKDGVKRFISIFAVPPEPNLGPITPIDRLTDIGIAQNPTDLTPQIHRTYFVSKLYQNRMRRLKIGGLDLRLVLIVFGIVGLILALMFFSGYLGR